MYKQFLLDEPNVVMVQKHRIMVIGNNVTTVQRVSSYCLGHNFEVLPYYGVPLAEEISLFTPHAMVLCLPIPDDFHFHLLQPCVFWAENSLERKLPIVSAPTELYLHLQKVLVV